MYLRLAAIFFAAMLTICEVHAEERIPAPDLSDAAPQVREVLTAEAAQMASLLDAGSNTDTLTAAWRALGDSYFAHDYFSAALACYEAATALAADDGSIAYRTALAYLAEGRLEDAIAPLSIAVELATNDIRVPALVRRGRAQLERGDTDSALSDFRDAVRLAPESPAALGGLGRAELAAGNAEAARQHLSRAIEIDPAATRLRQPLGMAYRSLGDRPGARRALIGMGDGEPRLSDPVATAITQRSRSPAFFLQTGLAQAGRGDFDTAVALIGRAVALAPEDLSILSSYGQVLAESGRFKLARKALQRVIAGEAATVDDWLYLGGIEQVEENFPAAEAAFGNALALEPDNPTAVEAVARITLHRRDFQNARTAFLKLAAADSDAAASRRYFYWAGVAALATGDCDNAISDLEASGAGGRPYDPALLQALARARATCPGIDATALQEALDWSEQIYAALPGLESSVTLAMVYAARGRFQEAVELQTQAIFEALKLGQLEARSGLKADMARYRQRRPAERALRPDDPLFHLN